MGAMETEEIGHQLIAAPCEWERKHLRTSWKNVPRRLARPRGRPFEPKAPFRGVLCLSEMGLPLVFLPEQSLGTVQGNEVLAWTQESEAQLGPLVHPPPCIRRSRRHTLKAAQHMEVFEPQRAHLSHGWNACAYLAHFEWGVILIFILNLMGERLA